MPHVAFYHNCELLTAWRLQKFDGCCACSSPVAGGYETAQQPECCSIMFGSHSDGGSHRSIL